MTDQNCVFCKIVAGDLPAQRLLENDSILAFLDINPLAEGHTVVIPKRHAEQLHELPEEAGAAVGRALGRLGATIAGVVGAEGYNVLQNNGSAAGQVVPHVHFHLIPRRAGDGLGYRWNAQQSDAAALQQLGDEVRAAL